MLVLDVALGFNGVIDGLDVEPRLNPRPVWLLPPTPWCQYFRQAFPAKSPLPSTMTRFGEKGRPLPKNRDLDR